MSKYSFIHLNSEVPPLSGRFYLIATMIMIISIFFVSQCAAPPSGPPGELPVIRYVNFKVYDPVYVAIDQGFFAKHGVDVQIVGDTLAGPTAIQAVAAGSAEAALSSIPAIINANAAGLPVIGVSDIQSALPGQPLEYYYSLKESGIDSVEDLVGTKHAINLIKSSFHYTALMALDQKGIPEDQVEFILIPFDKQLPALMAGEVDVIGLMEPYNGKAKAVSGDQLQLVYDASDVFGSKQFTLHFFNRIWANDHPDQAKAFVAGVVDAIAWIESHEEEAKPIIAKYTMIEPEYVPTYHFQKNGMVIMDDVRFWLQYLVDRGDIEATWLTPEMIATNEYNPFASQNSP